MITSGKRPMRFCYGHITFSFKKYEAASFKMLLTDYGRTNDLAKNVYIYRYYQQIYIVHYFKFKNLIMKKLIAVSVLCISCYASFSQDKMDKKMENKTDKMDKKMENKTDKMNKKIDNKGDKMLKKIDTTQKKIDAKTDKVVKKVVPKSHPMK